MLQIPFEEIKEKILSTSGITEDELNKKIKVKLDQLSGLISREGAAHIIANELGVKLFESTSGKLKIEKIVAGMRNVETAGKILAVYEKREFKKGDNVGKVGSFLIGDETGTIRIVCWGSQADLLDTLTSGNTIRVISGYVRENNGRKEIHLNDRSKVLVNPKDVVIGDVKTTVDMKRKKIEELTETDRNIELLGTIVQLENLRFYEVCPECNKRVKQREESFFCEQHEEVTPRYSYVCNVNLDDGTGSIRVVMFRELVEKLLSKDAESLISVKDQPEKIELMKTAVLGEIIKVRGRVNKNELFNRTEFMCSELDMHPDPKEELQKLDAELGRAKQEEIKSIHEI